MSKKAFFIFEPVRKKSFFIILGLSMVVTYGVAIIDDLRRNSLLAGEGGVPFRFSSGTLFGSTSINYFMLLVDISFWFVIIWLIWFGIKKIIKR